MQQRQHQDPGIRVSALQKVGGQHKDITTSHEMLLPSSSCIISPHHPTEYLMSAAKAHSICSPFALPCGFRWSGGPLQSDLKIAPSKIDTSALLQLKCLTMLQSAEKHQTHSLIFDLEPTADWQNSQLPKDACCSPGLKADCRPPFICAAAGY